MAKELLVAEGFAPENIVEISEVNADAEASQAVVSVVNPDQFDADDYVVLGTEGSETAELLQVLSVSGANVTFTSDLARKHYKYESIKIIRSNQIKFYRAANVDGTEPDDADYSLISTVDIQADQLGTEYLDSTGGTGYWYKFTYYNETTTLESSLTEAVASRGGQYNRYTTVSRVRFEAGLTNNRYIDDPTIMESIEDAESEVKASLLLAGYALPLETVPFNVRRITTLLAAGFILLADYGPQHRGVGKAGADKIKEAREELKKIEMKKTTLIIGTGDEQASRSNNVRGYPDDSAEEATPSEERMFSIGRGW